MSKTHTGAIRRYTGPEPCIFVSYAQVNSADVFPDITRLHGKKRETVEYLDLGRGGIHVAEYLTELPPREVLRERFHQALATARERLASGGEKQSS